jgi:hypothetical protein
MNQVIDPELQTQPAQQETSIEANLSVLRLQITYWLILTGVLAVVGTIALIFLLLWLLPSGLPIVATLELTICAIGVIGTLVGTTVGFLLGSMGKEQAEKRAEKNLALLLENLQKGHGSNGASSL